MWNCALKFIGKTESGFDFVWPDSHISLFGSTMFIEKPRSRFFQKRIDHLYHIETNWISRSTKEKREKSIHLRNGSQSFPTIYTSTHLRRSKFSLCRAPSTMEQFRAMRRDASFLWTINITHKRHWAHSKSNLHWSWKLPKQEWFYSWRCRIRTDVPTRIKYHDPIHRFRILDITTADSDRYTHEFSIIHRPRLHWHRYPIHSWQRLFHFSACWVTSHKNNLSLLHPLGITLMFLRNVLEQLIRP